MKTGYRALLLAGGIIAVAVPAFAQSANLLTNLNQAPSSTPMRSNHSFLTAAHEDVEAHRWKAAEAQLEQSGIFLLNGGVKASNGAVTSPLPTLGYVIQARAAVKQCDQVDALLAIDEAVATMFPTEPPSQVALAPSPKPTPAPAVSAPGPVLATPAAPIVTKALLPGHWELTGWKYHWVSPDTTYRTVQTNPFIPGHFEYRGGDWIWVAGHYAKATG